jgi:lipoyl(octanoyl) transferase
MPPAQSPFFWIDFGMSRRPTPGEPSLPAVAAHLLGVVDFEACLALQHRLVYETSGSSNGHITLLVCEHPPTITIGREGSRADVRFDTAELRSRRLEVRWVNRGGGTLLHAPGQLAVYPIVPLEWHGYRVGDYVERLEAGLRAALIESGFQALPAAGRRGVWGRSGQLVAIAAAVKSWVSYFGAYMNVAPPMQLVRGVRSDPLQVGPMSSLASERAHGLRMAAVRERVIRHLAAALGCTRCHIHSGHPLLGRRPQPAQEATARAG